MPDEPVRIERNEGIPRQKGTYKPIRSDSGALIGAEVCCPGCGCRLSVPGAVVDPSSGRGGSIECDCGLSAAVELARWKAETEKPTR